MNAVIDMLNILSSDLITGHAKSESGINGFKLDEIERDAVKIFNNSVITGKFTFMEEFWVTVDVNQTGLIDETNITELYLYAVRKHSDGQQIGHKLFSNGFHVEGDILTGTVNGFYVPDDTLTVNTNQIIQGESYFLSCSWKRSLMTSRYACNGPDIS